MTTELYTRNKSVFLLAALILISPVVFSATNSVAAPVSRQYELLKRELNRYYSIAKNGSWPKITLNKKYYSRGETDNVIKLVKQRLQATGDYPKGDESPYFNDQLADAIVRVEKAYGLKKYPAIDGDLVKALNVPVQKRIEQLQINMERLQSAPPETAGTRLVVNIPEFKLHVYEGSDEVFSMAVVVGKEGTKTVTFNDKMEYIVFSPYWNVPTDIVENEILPAARRDHTYLKRNDYEVVGHSGGVPDIRQKPGPENSLGLVKFVFPNSHNIYFHDTPVKSLFKFDKRAYSHGCIRLAEPAKLANYLLKNSPEWTPERIREAMHSGSQQVVHLLHPVPVYITYFTAWVDQDDVLNFREDIYGHDSGGARKVAMN
jgi:L,D-transpeptidase YcbB